MIISKDKNIFAKVSVPNWFEKVSGINIVKNSVLGTYFISDVKGDNCWNILLN